MNCLIKNYWVGLLRTLILNSSGEEFWIQYVLETTSVLDVLTFLTSLSECYNPEKNCVLVCLICLKVVLFLTSCTSALFYADIIYNYIIICFFNLQLCYWGFTSADFSSVVLSVDKTLRTANLFSLNTWNNTHSFQMKITGTFCHVTKPADKFKQ